MKPKPHIARVAIISSDASKDRWMLKANAEALYLDNKLWLDATNTTADRTVYMPAKGWDCSRYFLPRSFDHSQFIEA